MLRLGFTPGLARRRNLSVDLRKVLNKTASVKFAPHNYVNPVIVPVHIFALMTLRQKGKIVC